MVTRAELQRQTRAVQLQRQIRSRRIEELQQQALTQRSLIEQEELLKQQQQVEKQVSRTPTITERAFDQIIRAASGKRTAVTKDIANEYVRLLNANPILQEAVNTGQVVGLRARELGFTSAAEFLGVSQALTTPKKPKRLELSPEVKQRTKEKLTELTADIKALEKQKRTPAIQRRIVDISKGIVKFEQEAQAKARERAKRILKKPVSELSSFERVERLLLEQRGHDLPLGLQAVVELDPAIISGKKFSPFVPINFFSKKISESEAFNRLVRQKVAEKSPKLSAFLSQLAPKGLTEFFTILQLAIFFDPAFQFGVVKKGTKQVLVSKPKLKAKKKVKVKDVVAGLTTRQTGKRFRFKTFAEKVEDSSKILNQILKIKDPKIRNKLLQEFKVILRRAHGEDEANRILKEVFEELGLFPSRLKLKAVKKLKTRQKARVKKEFVVGEVPKIKGSQLPISLSTTKQRQKTRQKLRQASSLKQRQILLSLQSQAQKQKLGQKERQAQRLRQIFFVSSPNGFGRGRIPRRPRVPKRPGVPKKPIPLVFPILTPTQDKLRKAIQVLGKKKAMNVVVGLQLGKRKVIAKGLPPYRAIRKGQSFTDTNIQASYKLVPTGKKPKKKDIKPFLTSPKFRQSKTNPFFQVEKRKHRLDHPQEVKQLKLFKGKVSSGFFPKIKKKKRKRK